MTAARTCRRAPGSLACGARPARSAGCALALGRALGDRKARLDRLAEADLVREQGTLREGRRQREERYVDLMRVEVDARRRQRVRQRVLARPFKRDAMGQVRALVRGVVHLRMVAGIP